MGVWDPAVKDFTGDAGANQGTRVERPVKDLSDGRAGIRGDSKIQTLLMRNTVRRAISGHAFGAGYEGSVGKLSNQARIRTAASCGATPPLSSRICRCSARRAVAGKD